LFLLLKSIEIFVFFMNIEDFVFAPKKEKKEKTCGKKMEQF
jgi:hypothetical protein